MLNLSDYTIEQLLSEEFFILIKKEVDNLIFFRETGHAVNLARQLAKKLEIDWEGEDIGYKAGYLKLAVELQYAGLVLLTEAEMNKLFKTHILEALENEDIDLVREVKNRVEGWPFEEQFAIRKNIIKLLMENKQKFTEGNIQTEERRLPSTVGSWLIDYNHFTGAESADNIKRAQYLTNNINAKGLDGKEKNLLIKLLDFFDWLKLPANDPRAVSAYFSFLVGDHYEIFYNGEFVKVPVGKRSEEQESNPSARLGVNKAIKQQSNKAIPRLDLGQGKQKSGQTAMSIKEAFSHLDFSAIQDAEAKLKDAPDQLLYDHLHKNLFKRDQIGLMASLRQMAKRAKLPLLLADDQRARSLLANYFKTQNKPDLLKGLELNPANPHYLSLFLQYVFKDRLGLDEETAALYGMMLADLSIKAGRRDLARLVYYDAGEGAFKWL